MDGMTALDRVISSYSSSLKAMWYGRKQWDTTEVVNKPRVALVAMPKTPGARELEYAEEEIKVVRDICDSAIGACVHPSPVHKAVSAALETSTIFHFAGHGSSKVKSPLDSLLLLQDWKDKPPTVGDVMDMGIGNHRFLAYLSACGTGQVRQDAAVDESIHLIGAFQLTRFRNVVGTLWEVDDELCVSMARLFYQFIQKNGLSDESVSGGLAFATRQLRDRWVFEQTGDWYNTRADSQRDFGCANDGDGGMDIPLWVPYIHFGV